MFPEFSRFPGNQARLRAWYQTVGRFDWVMLVPLLLWIAIWFAMMWQIGFRVLGRATPYVFGPGTAVVWFGSIPFSAVMRKRRHQHRLREMLREHGIPVCIDCGYDLTGNRSGTCPECGAGACIIEGP